MKGNKELIKKFLNDSEFQDKLDYDKAKIEGSLIDLIEIYQEVYSREDNEILKEIGIDVPINKQDILNGLNRGYKIQLNNFKIIGGNVSEYPKSLEDLTK